MKFKDFREYFVALVIAIFTTAAAYWSVEHIGVFIKMERLADDVRIASQAAMPQSDKIVVAAITEETLEQFPYRSPVDRAFIADTLLALDRAGAKAIGVDILFDQPTEENKDDKLNAVIRELKTPLFISYSDEPAVVTEDQLQYLNAFVPLHLRADAKLLVDPLDATVREVFPGHKPGRKLSNGAMNASVPSFVGRALSLVGVKAPATIEEIQWRPREEQDKPPFLLLPAHGARFMPPAILSAMVKDKIVLLGAVLSLTDRHRTPYAVLSQGHDGTSYGPDGDSGNMPGVYILAHGISQYLEGMGSRRLPLEHNLAFVFAFALVGVGIGLLKRGIVLSVILGLIVLAILWVGGIQWFFHGGPKLPMVPPTLALFLSLWLFDLFAGRAERKQRQFVQGAFSRYVSPAVVGQLVDNPEALSISGKRQEATFVFTDIAGFTTLSEKLTSDVLSDVLNRYLDGACEIILKYEGTVDKFIGDAIMAIFNAPLPQPDHADRAVKCALELDAYAEAFRMARNAEDIPLGVTRIGVHAGFATIGNFGSHSRMDFTALGDTVNTAARTEGVNKYFGTRVCCTQAVVERCSSSAFIPIGDVVLKGKEQAVTLYSPVSLIMASGNYVQEYLERYEMLKADDCRAQAAFEELSTRYPDEPLVSFHLDRLAQGLRSVRIVMDDK